MAKVRLEHSPGVRAAAREIWLAADVFDKPTEVGEPELRTIIERHTHAGEMRTFIDNLASGDCQQCYAPERARVLILALDAEREEGR